MRRTLPHHAARAVAVLSLAVMFVAGCAGSGSAPSPSPSTEPVPASPVATLDIPSAIASAADLDGRTVVVRGFFLTDGETASFCELVLESYPPQCGGETLTLLGTVPAAVVAQLETPDDPAMPPVAWGTVEIEGTLRAAGPDGGPALEIAGMRIVGS